MVRCEENMINTDVFLKSLIFDFFRYFGVLGTARDPILAAFWVPGAAFWWSGRVLGIYCNIATMAGWLGVPDFGASANWRQE